MNTYTLLPADSYTVINKTILNETDHKNLINLYEPIIGSIASSLYLTLWSDLEKNEIMSKDFTHHHLLTILKIDINGFKIARESLEGMGLIRSYLKEGETNFYVYELYSPITAHEFFNHPIFNIVLYNNIGKNEYNDLKKYYQKTTFNFDGYVEITKPINKVFKSVNNELENVEIKKIEYAKNYIDDLIDYDLVISSLPRSLINERSFTKKVKELINSLTLVYDLDTLKVIELLRKSINENGQIVKDDLRLEARKYYQYSNNGSLPTLIYRTQPEYLKAPEGDTSNRGRMLFVFENTSPFDFLKNKYKGVNPTNRDLKLLEYLAIDLELKPAVINVLIDYVLKSNDNKLTQAYVETIAGQWKRKNIETASEAMTEAESQHKKTHKNVNTKTKKTESVPIWFDQNVKKEEVTVEEKQELENLLKEFR